MHIRNFILAGSLALVPVVATAEITWYVGLGAGGARIEEDLNLTYAAYEYAGGVLVPVVDLFGQNTDSSGDKYNPNYGTVASETLDKFNGTDLGYRVFAGATFNRFIGLEVGWVDLGEAQDAIELQIPQQSISCLEACRPVTDTALQLSDSFDGWDAFVVGTLPLNDQFDVFAKVGVIGWESTFKIKNAYAETFTESGPDDSQAFVPTLTPTSSTTTDDGTDLAGGIGVNYKATERITIRAEGLWYDIENVEQSWLLGLNLVLTY